MVLSPKCFLLLYFRKTPAEHHSVCYKMQGARKSRKSVRPKANVFEIMKPVKKRLLYPKTKIVKDLLSTPKSEEIIEYSQVFSGLNRQLVK